MNKLESNEGICKLNRTGGSARGSAYVLERSQLLRLEPERAFAFFTDARNLERITPPWLAFNVATPGTIQMRAGTLIDYRLKLHGVPVRWRTRIEVWEPPDRFVDVQLRGPYAAWEHTHTFDAAGEAAAVIGDRVRYALPLGVLGRLVHAAIVKRDLEQIFDYRERMVAELLQPTE
jgi:ligand-binding SRPBCC domain-containing protein